MDSLENYRFVFCKALIGATWLNQTVKADQLNTLKAYVRRLNTSNEETTSLKPYLGRIIREREGKEMIRDYLDLKNEITPYELSRLTFAITDLKFIEGINDADDPFLEDIKILNETASDVLSFRSQFQKILENKTVAFPETKTKRNDLDEFVRLRVMQSVKSKMLDIRIDSTLSPKEVAYITSLSALLGRVAHADDDFSNAEKVQISALLKEHTTLTHEDIDVVMATIAEDSLRGLDLMSITRTFYNTTTPEQRTELLNCLFLVANSDGHIDPAEVAEIEEIAVALNLSHRDILRAKAHAINIVSS